MITYWSNMFMIACLRLNFYVVLDSQQDARTAIAYCIKQRYYWQPDTNELLVTNDF